MNPDYEEDEEDAFCREENTRRENQRDTQPMKTTALAVREASQTLAVQSSAMTPGQAKIDAVASLTLSAYQRASQLNMSDEEVAALTADFPDEAFKPGAAGKESLIYIEHAFLRDRLNSVFRPGQWAIVPRNRWAEEFKTQKGVDGSRVYVEAMLCIRGCFAAEAVGEMEYYPSNGSQNYGDCVEGAKTAALRRCMKELGVGLQAWKKDWCDGWWARRRNGSKPSVGIQTPSAPKNAPTVPTRPKEQAPKLATEATKAWMFNELDSYGVQLLHDFAIKTDILLPTELLGDWPLTKVPTSKEALRALMKAIEDFRDGGTPPPAPAGTRNADDQDDDIPYDDSEKPLPKEIADVIVTIPRRGMTRDSYLKQPDTIGSLFAARHGTDDEAQEARQRLWGFVNSYEAKPWTGKDGKQRPPNASDVKFRESLDAFSAWFEKTHPDEKL